MEKDTQGTMNEHVQEKELGAEKMPSPSLMGMIFSPGEQFIRIKENPKIVWPIIILSILFSITAAIAVYSTPDALLEEQITQEMIDLGVTVEGLKMLAYVFGIIGGLITPGLTALIASALLLLIGKIVISDVTFKQLMSMNLFILVITLVGMLLNSSLRLVIEGDPQIYLTSLGSIVEAEGFLQAILLNIEVFTIWYLCLFFAGLQKVAAFSKVTSWIIAVLYFLILVLITVPAVLL